MSPPPPAAPSQRLVSLDVLRGFDMFWILGMEEVGAAVAKASNAPWARFVGQQLDHVPWAGFHFLDLIFPMFVFISGVSAVFSLDKAVATVGRKAAAWKLVKRSVILYALGVFLYGGLAQVAHPDARWLGVLQRLAICGLAGGMAYLYMPRTKRVYLLLGLLAGYWALMSFVPVPGFGAGNFEEGKNLANWIDAHCLGGYKWDGDHDPEGLLSTLPAIGSALLGIFAGEWLKRGPGSLWAKAGSLALAGVVCVAAGWLWNEQFPVIKKLWTSSFVLVAGGYSLLLLALAVAVVDGLGVRRVVQPFIWIGMNPITLYLSHHVVEYGDVSRDLLGGPLANAFGVWSHTVIAVGVVGLSLLLAWFLYSRRIFLRI
ncbi:MAG: DUF5009 domain-containing protein [Verrucomicrobiaceae bacterium]|nr:MAG: DUF5009 domain-containing protein [Verrucomicrobiaceae bacterium]